jgi:hypothetical protein
MPSTTEHMKERSASLYEHKDRYTLELLKLQTRFVGEMGIDDSSPPANFLRYGVARRFDLIGNAIRNIYRIFPPERTSTLSREDLGDVQINLHAFVINLSGCFDAMAWAFVLKHGLLNKVGGPAAVGMFPESTKRFLPKQISEYLNREDTSNWHKTYLKTYRDSLAHRIPVYVPPGVMSPEEATHYAAIEQLKMEALEKQDFALLDNLWNQQASIGQPCFFFLQTDANGKTTEPIWLHPQILSDTSALIDFGSLFLQHWQSTNNA